MRILNCTLTEFGTFRDETFTFGDGMNIIEGENESGKSTLLAFIRFMFYGVPRKSAGEVVPERDRILSWDRGVACGQMTLETADGTFRIERSLRRVQNGARESYPETVRLIDLATGEQIHKGEEPGEVFFGVPLAVFESTCAVSQTQCARLHTAELGSSIENLLFTGDESLNTQKATSKLDSVRRTLLHKNGKGGKLWELETERQILRDRLARARATAAARVDRQLQADALKKQATQQRARLAVCEEKCNNFENLALLRRFARMHELEKKTAALRARLDELHAAGSHQGYLPDESYISSLQGYRQQLRTVLSDRAQAYANCRQISGETVLDESRRERLAHAERLQRAGGREAVTDRFAMLSAAVRQFDVSGVVLLLVGILLTVAGGVGVALPELSTTVALICLFGGIFSAALGLIFLQICRKKKKELVAFLAEYGASPQCTAQALGGYLDGCLRLAREHEEAQERLQEATRLLAERERVTDGVCRQCIRLLARMGISCDGNEPEELFDRMDAAIERFAATAAEHGKVRREWERLDANLRECRAELAGQNEAALRAQLTPAQAAEAMGEDLSRLRSERDYLRRAVSDADARRNEMERQLASMDATAEDPGEIALRLETVEGELSLCRLRHDALVLAGEALEEASTKVRRGVTPRLRSGAGAWMSQLTDGRYGDLGISGGMAITLQADGETRPIEAMSGGTVDAAYLSLRLSLLEVLYGLDRPPLLLDESLCQLDDRRTAQFLTMLAGWCASGSQCLLFTCQSREARLCRDVGHFVHLRLTP